MNFVHPFNVKKFTLYMNFLHTDVKKFIPKLLNQMNEFIKIKFV